MQEDKCVFYTPVDLHWFFEISIRTEKKNQLELKKKFSQFITEILSQFEMNAEMDTAFPRIVSAETILF